MRSGMYFSLTLCAVLAPMRATCQQALLCYEVPRGSGVTYHDLLGSFLNQHNPEGWSVEADLETPDTPRNALNETEFLALSDDHKQPWLQGRVAGDGQDRAVEFLLRTDYSEQPLSVRVPLKLIGEKKKHSFIVRYVGYRLDLFCDGVLVDQEWPIGKVSARDTANLKAAAPATRISIWNRPIQHHNIVAANGGAQEIASRTTAFLGPEPEHIQYSRPRGYNANAGDAMPFFHNGTFHLFFLLDRRQHHSKWGLGAHQWGHISSIDLLHWNLHPTALAIDHEWEGSICTGSIFYHRGLYHAYYATRMPDRSERLAIAVSKDGIHFEKTLPTPFAEPATPFVRGPNRDPFVFEYRNKFHMLVTAAVPKDDGIKTEGVLEHLVSDDLSHWAVLKEPFLATGSDAQPECSDLFKWGDWYYLIFSLGGTTHYRMAKEPMGPWQKPEVEILDGPEAIVMKSAAFKSNRRILVGFLQHDKRYGGDLVFRELVQEKNGTLGTTIPEELKIPEDAPETSPAFRLDAKNRTAKIPHSGDHVRISATIEPKAHSPYAISIGPQASPQDSERLIFDPALRQVSWIQSDGNKARATLQDVAGLDGLTSITLTLYGTIADLCINGHRTLIHRLPHFKDERVTMINEGVGIDVSSVSIVALK